MSSQSNCSGLKAVNLFEKHPLRDDGQQSAIIRSHRYSTECVFFFVNSLLLHRRLREVRTYTIHALKSIPSTHQCHREAGVPGDIASAAARSARANKATPVAETEQHWQTVAGHMVVDLPGNKNTGSL